MQNGGFNADGLGSGSRVPRGAIWGGVIALGVLVLVGLFVVALNVATPPVIPVSPTATQLLPVFVPTLATTATTEAIPPTLTSEFTPTAGATDTAIPSTPTTSAAGVSTATRRPPASATLPRPTIPPTVTSTATPNAATVSFAATPSVIFPGESSTLSWTVVNAREVYLDGTGIGGVGSQAVAPPATQTYTLRVVSQDGTSREYPLTITVVTVQFTANPTSIVAGQTSTLSWSVANITAVYLDDEGVPGVGSRQVSPSSTQTYTLEVFLGERSKSYTVTITVTPSITDTPPPPATNTITPYPGPVEPTATLVLPSATPETTAYP